MDGLGASGCPALLITDSDYRVIDGNGEILEEDDLLHAVQLPQVERQWDWTVIPFGENSRNWRAVHRVKAIELGIPGS